MCFQTAVREIPRRRLIAAPDRKLSPERNRARISPAWRCILALIQQHGDVHGTDRVGQGAERDEVHAGLGDLAPPAHERRARGVDVAVVKPVAQAYQAVVPRLVRELAARATRSWDTVLTPHPAEADAVQLPGEKPQQHHADHDDETEVPLPWMPFETH